jgi:anti-anti-sigma factor
MERSTMSFSIVSRDDGVARVAVEGSLDCSTMALLRVELSTLLDVQPARIDLDLSSLRFVDNEGMGLLLSFVKRVYAQGGSLVNSDHVDQDTVSQLLRMADID